MAFGWKVLLPLSLAVVVITAVGILLADQFGRVHRLTTLLTLVTPGRGRVAERTGAFHIAVGQKTLASRTIGLRHRVLINIALL
jgi:hypothetical protein